jgi:hypothetical protein
MNLLPPCRVEHEAACSFLEREKGNEIFVISELVLVELYRWLRNQHVFPAPYTSPEVLEVI